MSILPNRELKVRFWDPNKKLMSNHITLKEVLSGKTIPFNKNPSKPHHNMKTNQGNLISMVSTEIFSQNEIEIFEGDIASYMNREGIYIGIVKYIKKISAYRLVFKGVEGVGDSWVELSHSITIMGNVFENQSLLARREAKPQRKTKPKNSSHETKDNILEEI